MTSAIWIAALVSAISFGTPLVIAALGELLSQRGGVLNLGVEGVMLVGAVIGLLVSNTAATTGGMAILWGFLAALLAGCIISTIHAFLSIDLQANQVVSGLSLTIFGGALGISNLIGANYELAKTPGVNQLERTPVLGLADLPVVGGILFNQNVVVYLSWLLIAVGAVYLYRSKGGLNLRAVGEDPASAAIMGLPVRRIRYIHTILGGGLAGVAGAYYTLVISPGWSNGITAGAGWIAVALVVFTRWNPILIPIGAYVFGLASGIGYVLQAHGSSIPSEVFSSLPYVATLLGLILLSAGRNRHLNHGPRALGVPYIKEAAV